MTFNTFEFNSFGSDPPEARASDRARRLTSTIRVHRLTLLSGFHATSRVDTVRGYNSPLIRQPSSTLGTWNYLY
ncbi:hypothetical protein V6N12_030826 [Hibiscus sabdariffa]|uniref:Uncharacterized protein n=1 Tax=Hibiscus sabdariffa TaxID=183260 RepID=A0ABR2E770_9ROSI